MKKFGRAALLSLYSLLLSISVPIWAEPRINPQIPQIQDEPNYKLYGFLALVVVMWIIFQGWPLLKKIRHFFKAVAQSIYINKKSTINSDQYRKLALGAIYSEQQTAYINSLETGLDAAHIRTILAEWWGIDSREYAQETLQYLTGKGYRFYCPAVLNAFTSPENQQIELLRHVFADDEDFGKACSQLDNLKETLDELKEDKVINHVHDIGRYGAAGWDIGRLVFVARLCYDAGYITDAEAWQLIEIGNDLARSEFDNWQSYAKSYVIGRAMWGGKSSFNSGIASIADNLLASPDSPWVQLGWK